VIVAPGRPPAAAEKKPAIHVGCPAWPEKIRDKPAGPDEAWCLEARTRASLDPVGGWCRRARCSYHFPALKKE